MKRLIHLNLLLLLISSAAAQDLPTQNPLKVLHTYDWKDLNVQSTNCQIQIVSMDGISVLKIENTNDTALAISLLKITNYSLIQRAKIIESEMKYENVRVSSFPKSGAFWQFFEKYPPRLVGGDNYTNRDGFYFNGTANWDENEISIRLAPYDNETLPNELEIKLWLPSTGTIYLRPVKLLGVVGSWWSPQQSGLIGGIGGSVIGCLAGLVGCLAGMGKARRFVLAMTKIFIALGILSLIAGGIAVATRQPYAVYYPLLLLGFILTVVFSVNLHSIQRRYDELEIRRMTSVDTMGG